MAEQTTIDIDSIETERLLGSPACLRGHPDIKGHIVRVLSYPRGRSYVLSYFWDGDLREGVLENFQVELTE